MLYPINYINRFLLHHAGRELDVQVFDGEFAGDEAGQKQVASRNQILIRLFQQFCLRMQFRHHVIKPILKGLVRNNEAATLRHISSIAAD